ncbi:MAG: hypothetical protein AABX70_09140 [Nanoarchaeota archaeon]|mgnify:FL=1
MEKMKDGLYCAKCSVLAKKGVLPKYEFLDGFPLTNVEAYVCPKCDNFFFTEKQAKEMERRTKKEYTFGFDRKVTISGRSLVIGIPAELAAHLKIKQGQKVRIIPIAREGFMIKKVCT